MSRPAAITASLLLLSCTLASFFYAAEDDDPCPLPDTLPLPATDSPDGSIYYTLFSPDGQFAAYSGRSGSHGCNFVWIYSCSRRQRIAEVGCVGDIFPPESSHEAWGVRWESNTELRVRYVADTETRATAETIIDVNDSTTFEVLGPFWRSLKTER